MLLLSALALAVGPLLESGAAAAQNHRVYGAEQLSTVVPGSRIYFEVPVPPGAASYRVSVLSFNGRGGPSSALRPRRQYLRPGGFRSPHMP